MEVIYILMSKRTVYIYLTTVAPGVTKVGKSLNPSGRFPNSIMFKQNSKPSDCFTLEVAAHRALQPLQLSKAAAKTYDAKFGSTELFGCSTATALEMLSDLLSDHATEL